MKHYDSASSQLQIPFVPHLDLQKKKKNKEITSILTGVQGTANL